MRLARWLATVSLVAVAVEPASARNLLLVGATVEPGVRAAILLDIDTIRDMNGYRRAWSYSGYKRTGVGTMTATRLQEVDCKEDRVRDLQITFFKPDHSFDENGKPDDWTYALPNSNDAKLIAFICGREKSIVENQVGDRDPFELFDKIYSKIPK